MRRSDSTRALLSARGNPVTTGSNGRKQMNGLKNLALGACAMLMVFLGSGAASMVSAHGGDSTLIHSCLNPGNGTIYVVGPNQACGPNQTALDWNIQGVA